MRQFPSVRVPLVMDDVCRAEIAEMVADRVQDLAVEVGEAWLYRHLNRFVVLPSERSVWRGRLLWQLARSGSAVLVGRYLPNVAAVDVMDDVESIIQNG